MNISAGDATSPAAGRNPKQKRAIQTRQSILLAAAEAFADRGFPAVTMADIAQLAGMTKGAVYFHYANKEALAVAVAEAFYARIPEVAAPAREAGSPIAVIRETLLRMATAFVDDKVIQAGARLQLEHHLIGAPLPPPFRDFTAMITDLLRWAEQTGQLPARRSPEALGQVLVAAFFGVQHVSYVQSGRADLLQRTTDMLDVIIGPLDRGQSAR